MIAALKYGFYVALGLILVNSLFIDVIGIENEFVLRFSGFSPFILLAIGLFLSMRIIKRDVYSNQLNYGQAIYTGVIVSSFIALYMALFNFVYFNYLNPDYVYKVIEVTKPLMVLDKLSSDEINNQIASLKESYLPINQVKGTFIVLLLTGVVFSAIFSSILRTQDTFTQITKPRNE